MPWPNKSLSAAECSGAQFVASIVHSCFSLRPAPHAISDIQKSKSSLISDNRNCYAPLEFKKGWTMLDVRLIERGLQKPGKTKGGLATAMGVRPGAVSEILSGIRLIKASEIAPIMEYLELNSVPIMGRVGAGASIEPEHEQVPPEGLGEVELPFPIAEEI